MELIGAVLMSAKLRRIVLILCSTWECARIVEKI
jgi:hypothetical protein